MELKISNPNPIIEEIRSKYFVLEFNFFQMLGNGLCMVSCGKSVVIFRCAANIINVCEFPLGNLAAINYTRC